MAARTNPTGEWCSPTREIASSLLIRLIDESRHCEAVAEVIHDAPTRQCPAAAAVLPARARCNNMLIDLRSLGDPDVPVLRSEPEVEDATVTLTYAPMAKTAMPPTAASVQSIATGARRRRKRVVSARLVLCLGVLVCLCLGVGDVGCRHQPAAAANRPALGEHASPRTSVP